METSISYSDARRNLKAVLDQVCDDREPVRITRRKGGTVVVIAEDEYASLEESAYLLRSPANARRLLEAIARDRAGEARHHLEAALQNLGLDNEAEDAG